MRQTAVFAALLPKPSVAHAQESWVVGLNEDNFQFLARVDVDCKHPESDAATFEVELADRTGVEQFEFKADLGAYLTEAGITQECVDHFFRIANINV